LQGVGGIVKHPTNEVGEVGSIVSPTREQAANFALARTGLDLVALYTIKDACVDVKAVVAIYAIKVDGKSRYNIYDDYDFYLDRWKHYISVAQDRHFNSAAVCWIVGYTCENSGYHFDEFFKGFGQKWMRRGCKLATLEQPFDVLMGRKRRNKNDLYLIRPHLLFPSTCEADRYFLKKLGEIGITE
jgi:hypothetical protein